MDISNINGISTGDIKSFFNNTSLTKTDKTDSFSDVLSAAMGSIGETLVVFYIIGAILKVILSCAFKAMEDRQKKAEAAEAKTDDSEVFDNDDDNDKPIS